MIAGPYIVTTKRNEGTRRFCDEVNINYAEKCSNYATVRMVGGRNDGMVFCTRHAPKRNRYAQAISDPVVLSRRAVATLDEARVWAKLQVPTGGALQGAEWERVFAAIDALPESGGTVGPLPDGTVIEVEATTAYDLWREGGRPTVYAPEGPTMAHVESLIDDYNTQQETTA